MSLRASRFVLFAGLIFAVAACSSSSEGPKIGGGPSAPIAHSVEVGAPLFPPAPWPKFTGDASTEPIRIPLCHLTVLDRVDVPSKEEGTMDWLGIEMKPGEKVAELDQFPHERKTLEDVEKKVTTYRRLRPGEKVVRGQAIALLNDKRAVLDVNIAISNIEGAIKDHEAAKEGITYYKKNLEIEIKANSSTAAINGARASVAKAEAEEASKGWTVIRVKGEALKAKEKLDSHIIRAPITGEVVQILKQVGESVRAGESVLQIQNTGRLGVEGNLELQYVSRVSLGAEVILEPAILEPPLPVRSPHASSKPIVAVATGKRASKQVVVTASEDGSVFLWDRETIYISWKHAAAVRALAVTRPGAARQMVLTGCDDGKVRVWSLDELTQSPLLEIKGHEGGVQAAAFSPDGAWIVAADDRGDLFLYDTTTGAKRYTFPREHNSSVSSLNFTPQGRVVSVGRDNLALIWQVGDKSAAVENSFDYRSGEVANLGVCDDGGQMLLDLDKNRLRMIDVSNGAGRGTLQQSGDGKFAGFALISPLVGANQDRLLLTTTGGDGVLQIWRWSNGAGRGTEVKKLICAGYTPPSCAAFSPEAENGFIVAGTRKGDVHLWPMPNAAEAGNRFKARITHIDPNLASSGRTVRITAEFDNPESAARLRPGTTATMVVPQK